MEDTLDRLTGLSDRDRFARSVDQADRDRDRMVVALIAIDGLAEVNQLCGYEAGDALLAQLGRSLAPFHSVDTTVGRIGGGQLGLLVVPAGDRRPGPTAAPVLAELDAAIARWLADRAGLGTPSPITPVARAGVAAGYGAGTWADAEAALAVALEDPDGNQLVTFDLGHPLLDGLRRRQRMVEDLASAIERDRLLIESTPVEPLAPGGASWTGLQARLGPSRGDVAGTGRHGPGGIGLPTVGDLRLAPGLAGRIDRRLLTVSRTDGALRQPRRRRDDRAPSVVSVSLLGPLTGPRSALTERPEADGDHDGNRPGDHPGNHPGKGTSLVVDVDQRRLLAESARGRSQDLATGLARVGASLGVTGFDGGWSVVEVLDRLPVHHLVVDADLVRGAEAGSAAARAIMAAAVSLAHERGTALVAPLDSVDAEVAAELGLTHRQTPDER